MKGIRSYLDFWNIWGMFQGSVGIYSDLIPHDFLFARGTKVQGRFPWVENLAERKKKPRGSVFFQGGKNNEHKQLCRTTSRKNQRMLIYANILYMNVNIYIYILVVYEVSERVVHNRIDGYVLLEKEIWEQTLCT